MLITEPKPHIQTDSHPFPWDLQIMPLSFRGRSPPILPFLLSGLTSNKTGVEYYERHYNLSIDHSALGVIGERTRAIHYKHIRWENTFRGRTGPEHLEAHGSWGFTYNHDQFLPIHSTREAKTGLARAIVYGITVVYEFGQAGWGGRVSFTDILAGIAGTEIANIPWYFIHKRKKREYKFKFEKKIWHVTVEEVHH